MKAFDLSSALKGEAVVTRKGKPVTQLVRFAALTDGHKALRGVIDGVLIGFHDDGRYLRNVDSPMDLLMAPKVRTLYMNVYRLGDFPTVAPFAVFYDTSEQATADARQPASSVLYLKVAQPVDIEE